MTDSEKRATVLEEKRHVSSKISDLSRYIGFGLVAVVYTIVTSDSGALSGIYESKNELLLLAGFFGVLTIVLDYTQFLAGYFAVQAALRNEIDGYRYDDKSISYRFRRLAFGLKQITALVGAVMLLFAMSVSIIQT